MNSQFLSDKFSQALSYDKYVQTGTPEQQRRWRQILEAAQLLPDQKQLVAGFVREMKVLVVSGIWCGDCVQQCPLFLRIAEANPAKIDLRFVDRDQHRDLTDQVQINAGDRVPVALFLAEDFEWCSTFGDRTLSRYRGMAARQLGPACPVGIIAPESGELLETLREWLNEFERIQLMLRLSSRLRQKHQD